jgi:NTE family protein
MGPYGARQAVVLSGGGARGAYEVGVLKALFEGASPSTAGWPLDPEVFTGTSVGAYNAAFLAQQPRPCQEAAGLLERVWRERIANTGESCGNGVYRLRADPFRLLDAGCLRNPLRLLADLGRDTAFWGGYALAYGSQLIAADAPLRVRFLESFNLTALFSRAPFESLVAETIDLGRLRVSTNALSIVTSDWRNGTPKVLGKADVTERLGTSAILASAAVPGIFTPVDLDGTPCVDGAIFDNTPLRPAIQAGADVIHVIYLDPLVVELPFPELPNTLDTFYRFYDMVLASNVRGDTDVASRINEELALLETLGVAGGEPSLRLRRVSRVAERIAQGSPYRPLVIHRYRPKNDLGGAEGFLDFREEFIAGLIAQGYQDALEHDCGDAGCVFPPIPESPVPGPEPLSVGAPS